MNQQRWTDQWTALHLAAMLGHLGVVQILVRAGANSRMEDSQGQTPADIATRFGFPGVARECCEANTETFRRERQIRRPDGEVAAVSHQEDLSENVGWPLQMSSVINNEQKGTRLSENCARGKGVNKKIGN